VNAGKTLFAQVMEFVRWTSFAPTAHRCSGDVGMPTLSCAEQSRVMAFAQPTWRASLRDIEVTLSANATRLYAMDPPSPAAFFESTGPNPDAGVFAVACPEDPVPGRLERGEGVLGLARAFIVGVPGRSLSACGTRTTHGRLG
jgi:hypothetical protein